MTRTEPTVHFAWHEGVGSALVDGASISEILIPTTGGYRPRTPVTKKGRATISVPVEIIDQEDSITMTGSFEWFIQKL